jgi:hypothetical protein
MAILALKNLHDWGMMLAMAALIFLFFMFMGVGASSYTTYAKCQKTNTEVHFKQAALWSIYPTVSFILIRTFEAFRIYFDRFYRSIDTSQAGKDRAGWISVGYVVMLAAVAGMFSLMDHSIEGVCVPTIDEAQKFKQDMLKRQADKAKAQESTPAVKS